MKGYYNDGRLSEASLWFERVILLFFLDCYSLSFYFILLNKYDHYKEEKVQIIKIECEQD